MSFFEQMEAQQAAAEIAERAEIDRVPVQDDSVEALIAASEKWLPERGH